jgi:type IV pilus assembly protein PilY1
MNNVLGMNASTVDTGGTAMMRHSSGVWIIYFSLAIALFFLNATPLRAGVCEDGVGVPPFLVEGVDPNLLLVIDNSASMYDMAYDHPVEPGYCNDEILPWTAGTGYAPKSIVFHGDTFYQTTAGAPVVVAGPPVEYQPSAGADPASDTVVTDWEEITFAGYFDADTWYLYDLTDTRFEATTEALAGAACAGAAGATKIYANNFTCLSVNAGVAPQEVKAFAAKGHFLNWATSSKLDVEKQILTGGKYVSGELVLESRGCLGRKMT